MTGINCLGKGERGVKRVREEVMRTGHIHILRESASVLEMHENRGFTVRRKTSRNVEHERGSHTDTQECKQSPAYARAT